MAASEASGAQQVEAKIRELTDWRGETLARLRTTIKAADPDVVEDVKWRKPSNPSGAAVWSHGGIICIGEALKRAVRLTFPKGARVKDPKKLFNARLESATVRATDFYEGVEVDQAALRQLVLEAVRLNASVS